MGIELPKLPPGTELLTVRQAAKDLDVTIERLEILIARGKLKAKRFPLGKKGAVKSLVTLKDCRVALERSW